MTIKDLKVMYKSIQIFEWLVQWCVMKILESLSSLSLFLLSRTLHLRGESKVATLLAAWLRAYLKVFARKVDILFLNRL